MIQIDPSKLATAFVQPGTPMFSDVMEAVASSTDLSAVRKRDILSGLRRVAKALGRSPEDVPADVGWLQKRLEGVLPASIGLTAKSWSNALSDARAGLVSCGIVARKINRKADLSGAWKDLWQIVLDSGDRTLPKALPRFIYFLNRFGIEPDDVRIEHVQQFREALIQNEMSRDPERMVRTAVNAWNLAVVRFPQWPRQRFDLPSRAKVIKRKPDAFPDTFQADVERYLSTLSNPDLFSEDALSAPLKPATIDQYRGMLMRFASILLLAGIPAEDIRDLAALVKISNAEAGLRWMIARQDNKKTVGVADTANLLRNMARRYVKVGEEDQRRLDQLNVRLAVKQDGGMTPKNRDRLRPLEDPSTLRRLLTLPDRLLERGIKGGDNRKSASEREDAIAIAILLYCPIRRKNLFGIHLERNLRRMGDGRVFLVFEADEVKNSRRIEFELPGHVVAMIDTHLETRVPHCCPAATPWLFARRDGTGAANANYFCTKVKTRIAREIGLTINMHLFRHIAATVFLEANPGQYEVVKRLLGHSSLSQTLNVYAGFEAGSATRLFAATVDEARRI
jgi:integrase